MAQEGSSQLKDYWAIELQQWIESGLNGLRYCKENELFYNRLAYWRKKMANQCKPVAKDHTSRTDLKGAPPFFVEIIWRTFCCVFTVGHLYWKKGNDMHLVELPVFLEAV